MEKPPSPYKTWLQAYNAIKDSKGIDLSQNGNLVAFQGYKEYGRFATEQYFIHDLKANAFDELVSVLPDSFKKCNRYRSLYLSRMQRHVMCETDRYVLDLFEKLLQLM